jgi:uncharacterized protein YciI
MFIVSLTYIRPLSEVDAVLDAHVSWLKQGYLDGLFLASGRKVPRDGGVIMARASSREALERVLADDPFARAGVARYDVIEFTPSMTAAGLEQLVESGPAR